MNDETYLGDGVYAGHDGYHVWLWTQREDGVHRIALEPAVFDELEIYRRNLQEKYRANPS